MMLDPHVLGLLATRLLREWIEDAINGDDGPGNSAYRLPPGKTSVEVAQYIWSIRPLPVTYAIAHFLGRVTTAWRVSPEDVVDHMGLNSTDAKADFLATLVLSACGHGCSVEDNYAVGLQRARIRFFKDPGYGLDPRPLSVCQFSSFIVGLVDPFLVTADADGIFASSTEWDRTGTVSEAQQAGTSGVGSGVPGSLLHSEG